MIDKPVIAPHEDIDSLTAPTHRLLAQA